MIIYFPRGLFHDKLIHNWPQRKKATSKLIMNVYLGRTMRFEIVGQKL